MTDTKAQDTIWAVREFNGETWFFANEDEAQAHYDDLTTDTPDAEDFSPPEQLPMSEVESWGDAWAEAAREALNA